MMTIYKQVVEPNSKRGEPYVCKFFAPAGATPVSVGLQNGLVCVWYECDPSKPPCETEVYCIGTGFGAIPTVSRFIGTVIDDPYVWHFYAKL